MNLTPIAIIAIIFWGTAEIIKQIKKKNPAAEAQNDPEIMNQIAALKERVETLEKIVTDDGYDLKKQFKSL
ncbi:hypothetical protein [Neptunicella marina]|uniref:Phage shock protein B n=1 Tax=Neptunicella marina TaxID=2125989 RepID=A0A8J6J1M1_9ALTE|nr:hypothetical protein [Neptunicella marina]MBC3767882.1 hypothetical protein [Neptunicella marina]